MRIPETSDIDFVIPWVDGSDPEWRERRSLYAHERVRCLYDTNDNSVNSEARYRDWDILQYWFRAVEKYAPWVRKVHFVTCGQVPKWLNLNHPKLNFVRHEDYIPQEWLPTFSANPIELNLFRIKGLAEKFVYFNDDMFLNAPVKPTDFFVNGLPCDCAILAPLWRDDDGFATLMLNDLRVLQRYSDFHRPFKKNFWKWFNPRYGWKVLDTLRLWPWRGNMGFYEPHIANAYLKSTFIEVWEKAPRILKTTSSHRFRNYYEDVNQWVMRNWQLLSGKFYPRNPEFGWHYSYDFLGDVAEDIKSHKHKVICLSDSVNIDYERLQPAIRQAYQEAFPEKSAYEV